MNSFVVDDVNALSVSFALERQHWLATLDGKLVRAALLASTARTSRAQPSQGAQPESGFPWLDVVAARAMPDGHPTT